MSHYRFRTWSLWLFWSHVCTEMQKSAEATDAVHTSFYSCALLPFSAHFCTIICHFCLFLQSHAIFQAQRCMCYFFKLFASLTAPCVPRGAYVAESLHGRTVTSGHLETTNQTQFSSSTTNQPQPSVFSNELSGFLPTDFICHFANVVSHTNPVYPKTNFHNSRLFLYNIGHHDSLIT